MDNFWLSLAGVFMLIAGGGILIGVRGFVSAKRDLSVKRQRLLGGGFILLGVSFLLQGLPGDSTGVLVLSAFLALLAVVAFVWSIVVARQDANSV